MISPKYDVLVTDSGDALSEMIEQLSASGASVRLLDPGTPAETAADIAAESQIPVVVVGLMHFTASEIERLNGTGLIIRAGIGYDEIDVDAASAHDIWVANVPDYCVDEVADHTMLLLAAAMRSFPPATSVWREKNSWNVASVLPNMYRMRGKQLGLVGFGRIGQQVAARARGFGWNVVATDPQVPDPSAADGDVSIVTLEELLRTSDAVSLHCPLNSETHYLINSERLSLTQRGVVIVNTSRGGVVDLKALGEFVASGHVAAAALDVLDGEPEPDLTQPLLTHPNVIVTPHIGWRSTDASRELCRLAAEETLRYLGGQTPFNLVNGGSKDLA